MQACNVVKFKVKPGQENAFLDAHRSGKAKWPGLERGVIIKTGEQTFCLIGMWGSEAAMAAARPAMIKTLDSFRATLDDQGEGRGVTDAVSGAVVLDL
jgi:quinol monooxygenase YgiN